MAQTDLGADPTGAGAPAPAATRDTDGAPLVRAVSQAAETRRLYAADWAAFVTWCRERRHAALPASPAAVAAYLGSLSATLKHGAIARRAAAIAGQHRWAGHSSPGTDPAVRDVLRAARDARGSAGKARPDASHTPWLARPARRPPPGPAQLARMAARCPGDLAGLRDRVLLLLTASGLGGERLLALDCEHVRFTGQGMELAVAGAGDGAELAKVPPASAGGRPAERGLAAGPPALARGMPAEGGEVRVVARMTASVACPVRALEEWLRGSDTRFGPVFRKVDRWGTVEHRRLRTDALRRIWQRRAKALRASR